MLKLDFAKAFDYVNWGYILNLLKDRGFDHQWVKWISMILWGWGEIDTIECSPVVITFILYVNLKNANIQKIYSIRRKFLWAGVDHGDWKKYSLVRWDRLCRIKEYGGRMGNPQFRTDEYLFTSKMELEIFIQRLSRVLERPIKV